MRNGRVLRWIGAAMVLLVLVAACGDAGDDAADGGGNPDSDEVTMVLLSDQERAEPSADPALAGEATLGFGADLFGAVVEGAGSDENVIVSPLSVAIALAMVEPGAVGEAQRRLREVLRIEDPAAFHASMNALEQSLEARMVEEARNEEEDPGEVTTRIANAAYLQEGYPFVDAYLETVGTHYGPVLNAVDFEPDPDAVARDINRFVEEATAGRITDIVGPGVLTSDTVLALVNALYLKASWLEVFPADETEDGTFTRLDGTDLTVPMMHGESDAAARGEGWVAATKSYVGGLAAQFILPDERQFDAVAGSIEQVVEEFEELRSSGAELAVPRFETRFGGEISDSLQALGLTPLYERGGLVGIADDPRLVLYRAIHETFVAMDEEGTEAAAATVLAFRPVSEPIPPPPPVILDRPFLFRIFDQQTGATLFLGRVMDPTA